MNILLHGINQFAAGVTVNRVKLAVKGFKLHPGRQVVAIFIQQHTYRRRWQEAVELQLLRRLGFDHVNQFHQQRTYR